MDTLDPNLIEAARSELDSWTRRTPEVAALAGVASLARSIEPELLRALRIGLGTRISGRRISVSAESALWFSSFVESRGTDAITLLPEALHVLRPLLADDPQLLKDARIIVEDCHKSAPDVLQWEERIVYLALTGQTALLEEEIRRGLRSVSQGTRQPLASWISDMWLRLPPAAKSNPLLVTLYQHVRGMVRRQSQSVPGGESSGTDLIFDFSAFPTRELGVVLRDNRFVIGDVPEAEFGIAVPDLEPVEMDVAFGSSNSWVEQRTVRRGQVAEIDIRNGDTIRVRTLAGRIHELSVRFFRPPPKRISPRVFISYSHDSPEHGDQVLAFSEQLRAEGIDTELDMYVKGPPPEGWPRWHQDQIDTADFVLVICTENFYRRFGSDRAQYGGLAENWDVEVIAREIYSSRRTKFIPVCLSDRDGVWIPEQLSSLTSYRVFSPGAYNDLVRRLTQQPRLSGSFAYDEKPAGAAGDYDISRIIKYAPAELIGREEEMKFLDDAWQKVARGEKRRPHILTFAGLGGEGKTSLVAKWATYLAYRGWPKCDAAFAWSFSSQGASDRVEASSDSFLKAALNFFGDSDMANSAASAFDKAQRLAQLVGKGGVLLILDGLEPLQHSPASPMGGELKDAGMSALLKALAISSRGLCIVTTRYSIPDLRPVWQTTAPEITLARLPREAGVHLLQSLGVRGTQTEFEKLVDDVKGHALTLNLVGNYLRDAHEGDIRKRDLVDLGVADAEEFGGSSFRMYAAYIRWLESEGESGKRAVALLRLLGLFDRPATIESLSTLWQGEVITGLTEPLISLSETQRNLSLKRLEDMKLLTIIRDSSSGKVTVLDAHPMLREFLAKQLKSQRHEAWRSAHRRLYEHLITTTTVGSAATLEDLEPLAQAIGFGCQAGLYQEALNEVYVKRLQRNEYVWRKLGAFNFDLAVVANFFERPWSRVSPVLSEPAQAFVLNNAALDLRALGRLTEALEPMRAASEMRIRQGEWKNAAITAGNLSELELTVGDTAKAVESARQAVSYADRSDDMTQRASQRATLANALNQTDRRKEAHEYFRDAERFQALYHPFLSAVSEFHYCDLQLRPPELHAWQVELEIDAQATRRESVAALSDLGARAAETLHRASLQEDSLLSLALARLTLSCVVLYSRIADHQDQKARSIESLVTDLRRAGQQQYLPYGLLCRAWLQCLEGKHVGPESAQADLDEAWEIAERGPMRLFMADIHLYRARLFHAVKPYPWNKFADGSEGRGPKDDLADARKLIEKCGYWRRKEELEDAEEAAKSWT
jgi:tetratricopeptide (TPR) repeat protein